MRLTFEQRLPAPPAAVWPYLTEPARMNEWSEARVSARAPGDLDGVGAMRRISIASGGRKIAFDEVIEVSEPPRRLVYRVVEGLPVRHHRGEITLRSDAGGARMRWDVEFTFPLPGMGSAARIVLERQLARSLRALARAVEGAVAPPLPAPIDVADLDAVAPLRAEALVILEEQRALAEQMERAGDPKRWFTRVYAFVTENQIALCDARAVPHPAWVLRLIPRFHHYYASNLRGWIERRACESQWRAAFFAMEELPKRVPDPLIALSVGLAKGVRAHIEEDLPRALAETYVRFYAGRCAYARFRADYLLMRDVFRDASDRTIDRIPRAILPLWMRATSPFMTAELREALVRRRFYDVRKKRRLAFDRGERLANMLLEARG